MTTSTPTRILVPTDFSETAGHAVRYASNLARRLGAHLTVLYADLFPAPVDFTATIGGWEEFSVENMKARAEEDLQRTAGTNVHPTVAYETLVRVDTPLDGILATARETGAELIVMGTHGRTGVRRLIIGSVTEAVMRLAPVPVIAVPPGSATRTAFQTIVCPVIYTPQFLDALTFAARIAPPEARFILLRATPADDPIESANDLMTLRAWVPETIAARCEFKLLGDEHTAERVEDLVKRTHADLIVAAEPADRSPSDMLHGTFAARLVQHSDSPVLTMNAPAMIAASCSVRKEEQPELAATTA